MLVRPMHERSLRIDNLLRRVGLSFHLPSGLGFEGSPTVKLWFSVDTIDVAVAKMLP